MMRGLLTMVIGPNRRHMPSWMVTILVMVVIVLGVFAMAYNAWQRDNRTTQETTVEYGGALYSACTAASRNVGHDGKAFVNVVNCVLVGEAGSRQATVGRVSFFDQDKQFHWFGNCEPVVTPHPQAQEVPASVDCFLLPDN